jgi:ubiquitin-protein ligase E3 C
MPPANLDPHLGAAFGTPSYISLREMRHGSVVVEFTKSVLTIPLLPNRLPLKSLTQLSSAVPYTSLPLLLPVLPDLVATLDAEGTTHLIANLTAFVPPRYAKLPAPALEAYLRLLIALMSILPPGSFEAPEMETGTAALSAAAAAWAADDEDSDYEDGGHVTTVRVVSSFTDSNSFPASRSPIARPKLDTKTRGRLQTLAEPKHLGALLSAVQHAVAAKPGVFAFLLALVAAWPMRREKILGAVLAHSGGAIVREIYRGAVRGSGLGNQANSSLIFGEYCHLHGVINHTC